MTARTGHEAGLSARVGALPTPAQSALLKILARTATRQMESAYALLEDLGMAGESTPAVDHTPEQDAAGFARPPAEEEHAAPPPLRAVPPAPEVAALIPCPPAVGGERTCDSWHGNFCCTGSVLHAGLAHASHAENGDVIGVWPATTAPKAGAR